MVNLSINESSNIHRAGIIPIEAENMESKCRIFLPEVRCPQLKHFLTVSQKGKIRLQEFRIVGGTD